MRRTLLGAYALLSVMIFLSCKSPDRDLAYTSNTLKIIPVTENSFVHVSYLTTIDFGKVPCNGLIYVNGDEAAIFDTPTDQETSKELLSWLMEEKGFRVRAVVINHFHSDCLGGLEVFHSEDIASYASNNTLMLANKNGSAVPEIGFAGQMVLKVGDGKIINRHFGEAHTSDNIASYVPSDKLLYGGCAVKAVGATKGNLEDANVLEWSKTISMTKGAYPDLKIVVPGHGDYGDTGLLDYTIKLFSVSQ